MLWIDPPSVEKYGRLWSHLISDESYEELHAFARLLDIPERGFGGDHYDLPDSKYDEAITLGARPARPRELVVKLVRAGLRARTRDITPS